MNSVSDKANFRGNTGGIARKFNEVWRTLKKSFMTARTRLMREKASKDGR
jgi:hypothetical protein